MLSLLQQGTIRFRVDERNGLTIWLRLFDDDSSEVGPIHLTPEETEALASHVEEVSRVIENALRRAQDEKREAAPRDQGTGTHPRPDFGLAEQPPVRRLRLVRTGSGAP